jgi:hypothetical protein
MATAPRTPAWSRRGNVFSRAVLALALLAGCSAGVKATQPAGAGGNDGGAVDVAQGVDAPPVIDVRPPIDIIITQDDGSVCTPVSCTPPGGQYCGPIGDGCHRAKVCPDCSGAGQTCVDHMCVEGPTCTRGTCAGAGGARYCGRVGSGCGEALDCGGCPTGNTCSADGVCVPASCTPAGCDIPGGGGKYCGRIGDGCGRTIDCSCAAPLTCAGSGIANVCGDPNCVPITCTPTGGGQYCGTIGNGCGGTQDCGACANGMACPTAGTSAHICPGSTVTAMPTCTGATKTTISGTVYDPAGVNPLYNIIVYVPSGPLPALSEGVTCDRCGAEVNAPLASALTDVNGHFSMTLEPVPSTTNVPLVMQIGKWRRQITIPSIQTCKDNPLTDKNQTRLPRTSAEGHIPRIAVTTGGADALECLPRRIGIADSEITTDAGAGRVHLYAGGDGTNSFMAGGTFSAATTLWSNKTKLANYDVVIMSCEGSTSKFKDMKPQASVDNVTNYANSGGRIFLSHLHFYWLQMSPMFVGTASYPPHAGGEPTVPVTSADMPLDLTINTTFPKGMALAQWLAGPIVMASPTLGHITAAGLEHSVTAVTAPTTEWIYLPMNPRDSMHRRSEQYLSFNTPVGTPEAMQCGKAVFTDIHIKQSVASISGAGGDDSDPSKPFPMGCKPSMMTPQAKALEFLFFDLTSCVEPPTNMPQPPIVPPPGTTTGPPPGAGKPPAVPPPPPPPPPPDPG